MRKATKVEKYDIGSILPATHSLENNIFDILCQAATKASDGVVSKGSQPSSFKLATEMRSYTNPSPLRRAPSDSTLLIA